MRFGGVLVMMSSDSTTSRMTTIVAPTGVMSRMSGCASIQPRMPPARASTAMPSLGSGWPPKMWQSADTDRSSTPSPMPMRVLSCTELGCRNSHTANSSMTTGSANATRPNSPPNVHESSVCAMDSLMKNHSTTAPQIASTTMKNGSPSRRSSFCSVSGPSARAAPPATWASPIHARTSRFGPVGAAAAAFFDAADALVVVAGSFLVGAVREPEPRDGVPEARPFDLVLVAMVPTLRPTADAGLQQRASVCDHGPESGHACRRRGGAIQRSGRTIVSRPPAVSMTVNPSDR